MPLSSPSYITPSRAVVIMSSSSSVLCGLRGLVVLSHSSGAPIVATPVTFYRSTTEEHDGWVVCDFWHWELEYVQHVIETRVLVGNADVDAFGAARDRREDLEIKTNVANAGRRGIAGRGNACRVNFGSHTEKNLPPSSKLVCCLEWVEIS
ncbi:Coatomer subunit gamma-2 [Hordeum vulgare]|nr:Coatomer subunit gamma-2 [Hordeum vulgare]